MCVFLQARVLCYNDQKPLQFIHFERRYFFIFLQFRQ